MPSGASPSATSCSAARTFSACAVWSATDSHAPSASSAALAYLPAGTAPTVTTVIDAAAATPTFTAGTRALTITAKATATGDEVATAWTAWKAVPNDPKGFEVVKTGSGASSLTAGVVDEATLPALVGGDDAAVEAALRGRGVPAIAFAAPTFVDFDGGGYRAPFHP